MKEFERELKEEQAAERQREIDRIKENRKRRAENENKSVQYQVVRLQCERIITPIILL